MLLPRSLGAALLFLGVLTVDPLSAPDLPGLIAAAGALLGLGLMVPNPVLLLTLTLGLSAARIDLAGSWIPGLLYPALALGAALGLSALLGRRFRQAMLRRREARRGEP
ncbi:MAG: hypothetical protein ISQ02_04075 [Pseudomonadales bacterium]|nr:hypothetical protein [Pseudomonadales bacterium]